MNQTMNYTKVFADMEAWLRRQEASNKQKEQVTLEIPRNQSTTGNEERLISVWSDEEKRDRFRANDEG